MLFYPSICQNLKIYTHRIKKKRWMMQISDCIDLCSEQNNVRMNCRKRLIGVSIQSYSQNPSGKSRSQADTTSLRRLVIWLIKAYMCLYAQPMRSECAPNDTFDVPLLSFSVWCCRSGCNDTKGAQLDSRSSSRTDHRQTGHNGIDKLGTAEHWFWF